MTIAEPSSPGDQQADTLDLADGLARVMGDRALFARLLRQFAADYRVAATAIGDALNGGNLPLAHRLSHTLQGAAGMIGAHALSQHARTLERSLRQDDSAHDAALDATAAALDGVLAAIDGILSDAAGASPLDEAAPPAFCAGIRTRAEHYTGLALVSQLAQLLANGDGAAVDLVAQSGASLAAALGQRRFREVALAVKEFDFEGALEALRVLQDGAEGEAEDERTQG